MNASAPRFLRRPAGLTAVAAALLLTGVDARLRVRCDDTTACPTVRGLRRGEPLPEAIHILDREGRPLADVAGPLRLSLGQGEFPPLVRRAFVAVEDRRFYRHQGVDVRGVLRAAARNLRAGAVEEGASTIPMQLVRTLWAEQLRGVGAWRRKVMEARAAPRLIGALGHDAVLDLYLNAIYLGNGVHGVGMAARYYFDRELDELSITQVATLVGMTRAPEAYEPRRHPERARARRDLVLELLAREGVVGAAEAKAARAEPLETATLQPGRWRRSYLSAAVTRELREVVPRLESTAGIRVHTTVDAHVQHAGEAVVEGHVAAMEAGRFGRPVPGPHPLQMAAVALDPRSGAVRGWIGGRDFGESEFDRVDQARRPVGSLVKPLVVAAALERGFGILDMVSADSVTDEGAPSRWLPRDHVAAAAVPMREALIRSSNRASVQLGYHMGLDGLEGVARRAGLEGRVPAVPAAYVGAFDASLLEMTAAYAAFGNGGLGVEPHLVERVVDRDGAVLWSREREPAPARVFDPATSWVVLDALRDVVDRGTARGVRAAGYLGPAAGKTGTTDDVRDAWFVGVTPGLAAGIWIGHDAPRPTVVGGSGGSLAAPAWGRWMAALPEAATGGDGWAAPGGVVRVRYGRRTGRVLEAECGWGGGEEYLGAWVRAWRYPPERCPSGLSGWLRALWRSVAPEKLRAAPLPAAVRTPPDTLSSAWR